MDQLQKVQFIFFSIITCRCKAQNSQALLSSSPIMRFCALIALSLLPLAVATAATKNKRCRCFPGDACWPSEQKWDAFNSTVGGRLIKTVPLGSPCHDPHYDEALCEELKSQWQLSPIQ
jgi:hypothetical protein